MAAEAQKAGQRRRRLLHSPSPRAPKRGWELARSQRRFLPSRSDHPSPMAVINYPCMRVAVSRRCSTAKRPSGAAFLLSFVSNTIFLDRTKYSKETLVFCYKQPSLANGTTGRSMGSPESRAGTWRRPQSECPVETSRPFSPLWTTSLPAPCGLTRTLCFLIFLCKFSKYFNCTFLLPCFNFEFRFRLTYRLILREKELHFNIGIYNPSKDLTFSFNLLLHTYFKVPDVRRCQITGLHGCTFIDKVCSFKSVKIEFENLIVFNVSTDERRSNVPRGQRCGHHWRVDGPHLPEHTSRTHHHQRGVWP
jgi:Aldose 1-epimerase